MKLNTFWIGGKDIKESGNNGKKEKNSRLYVIIEL